MNNLFPLPIYTFLKIASRNEGISPGKIKHLGSWMLKTILFEPLRWVELAAWNKKVERHEITRHPLFILGFYRSGTSYLHQCFTLDDRLGYHSNYQMALPEIMLSTEKTFLPVFEFICRTFRLYDAVHRVPLSFRFPGEEDATMTTFPDPRGAQWGYFFPASMEAYFQKYVLFEGIPDSEREAWTASFLYLLRKISLANEGKRLVLKSPPNTARIRLLLSLFPHARFLFIHRNPYDVYSSNKRFWQVIQQVYALQDTGSVDVNGLILDMYSRTMQRYLAERQLAPPGQLMELSYAAFIQDPVGSLKKAYQTLDLGDFDYCEQKMMAFTGGQKSFKRLRHELPEEEKRRAAEKLEPFLREWNYPLD